MSPKNDSVITLREITQELVIAYIRTLPNATEMFTSHVPGEGNPGPFYRSLDFVETGKIDDDENVMRLDLEGDA